MMPPMISPATTSELSACAGRTSGERGENESEATSALLASAFIESDGRNVNAGAKAMAVPEI